MLALPDRPIIGAQLDLKGVAWKPGYLDQLLTDMAACGINTLLVEYEDVFPYAAPIDVAMDPKTVWSPRALSAFLDRAAELGLEIIPLQQCLGHLEYLFRWDRYRQFAEGYDYPSTVKVGDPKAMDLLKDMLRQVMQAHPNSRYIHLGMDEAHDLRHSSLVAKHGGILGAFLAHLDVLCDFCASHGKTPIIWTDMIEDHYDPKSPLLDLKDRVLLVPWDYASDGKPRPAGRIHGWRQSRDWWKNPERDGGLPIDASSPTVEDLPANIRREIAPYFDSETKLWKPMWQVDWLSSKGLHLIGGSTVRCSSMGEMIPNYMLQQNNLGAWTDAIKRNDQLGVIGTSWARGTTFCPPNLLPDTTWPGIEYLGQLWGTRQKAFWSGLPPAKQQRILTLVARCQQGWKIHDATLAEMADLRPKLKTHLWEWDLIALMVETHRWWGQVHFAGLEVDWFAAEKRPVDTEWQRRLDDQKDAKAKGRELRKRVAAHVSQRYHGAAYREWLDHLFRVPTDKLDRLTVDSRAGLKQAKQRYN